MNTASADRPVKELLREVSRCIDSKQARQLLQLAVSRRGATREAASRAAAERRRWLRRGRAAPAASYCLDAEACCLDEVLMSHMVGPGGLTPE